jgi:hypothetical protein
MSLCDPAAGVLADATEDPNTDLDGEPVDFLMVREGQHWCATACLGPDEAALVAASNVEPSAVRPTAFAKLAQYLEAARLAPLFSSPSARPVGVEAAREASAGCPVIELSRTSLL